MRRKTLLLALLPAAVVLGGAMSFAAEPARPSSELVPVAPAVNAQRGSAAALDGVWLAIGAPLEEVEQDEHEVENAGAVYVFRLEDGLWIQKARLVSDHSTEGGRFGHSVGLSGDTLAVAALGEGAVYVFTFTEDAWALQERLPEVGGIPYFGGAVTLAGEWLAVGAADPHGSGGSGAVHMFRRSAASGVWDEELPPLKGGEVGERFGHSLCLKAETLVVGAPGSHESKGAAHVFKLEETGWIETARLTASDAAAGDQLGFTVALSVTEDGEDIVAGAPTADTPGAFNSGALYAFRTEGDWSDRQSGRLAISGTGAGDQLGFAVAVDADLIAAGVPFSSMRLSGVIHVLVRDGLSWRALDTLEAGNADGRDLFGFSVAAQGNRVLAGAVLVDQGGNAAGSTYTFQCDAEAGCSREAEPVATDEGPSDRFGVSIDADGDTLVVGSLQDLFPHIARGFVYVYRRVGSGWLQEARLESPFENIKDAFGRSLSLQGNLLVVGAPLDNLGAVSGPSGDPTVIPSGSVYLFHKNDDKWTSPIQLLSPSPFSGDGFGRSVAVDGETIVVGSTGVENSAGAVYVFEEEQTKGVRLPQNTPGFNYGRTVAASGGMIAVGAPRQIAPLANTTVTLFSRSATGWVQQAMVSQNKAGFGHAIAMNGSTLLVGTSAIEENVYVFEPGFEISFAPAFESPFWSLTQVLTNATASHFGHALDIHENTAVILGSGGEGRKSKRVVAQLFFRNDEGWVNGPVVHAFARPNLDLVNTIDNPPFAVVIGTDFFAVTAPGEGLGDRVSIFDLGGLTPEEPQ